MLQKIKKQNKGFSLLELLLAIAIFSMGAISVGYLIIESVKATEINNKKIVATFYAREGLEAVRSIRNSNGFSDLQSHIGNNGLSFNSNTNSWSFSGANDSPEVGFVRVINLVTDGDYIKVQSLVSVSSVGRTISSNLSTLMANWQ